MLLQLYNVRRATTPLGFIYCLAIVWLLVIVTAAPSDREHDDDYGDDNDNDDDGMKR
jgi:hypothetical protein